MKYCSHCGNQIDDLAVVCVKCGCKVESTPTKPAIQLTTNRGLVKYILLSLITCGIYGLIAMSSIGTDINTIASKYDGKKTMHYLIIAFLLTGITCGIAPIVWMHNLSNRVGNELRRRGIAYQFDASTFWLWDILGSIIFVGPFVYMHKLFEAMNLLSADYNEKG